MSSEDTVVTQTGHDTVVPMIDESNCLQKDSSDSKKTESDLKLGAVEVDKCRTDSLLSVPAPPPRKLGRVGSVRRAATDASDATDIRPIDRKEIIPTFQTVVNLKPTQSDANEITSQVTEHQLNTSCEVTNTCPKSEPKLKDNSTQCLSTDRSWKKSDAKNLRKHPMERIRHWFTSDEAKTNRKRRLNRCLNYIKVFLTHLFSTTGLCLLVVAYSFLGAVIFKYLETKYEVIQRNNVQKERNDVAQEIVNYTLYLNVFYPNRLNEEILEKLKRFEDKIIKAVKEDGYGGETMEQWTFSGALLYSVTVITTIGYGNVTCKTNRGRIVTMIYALVGIPVMFLCLANLGNLMAQTFRFSYKRICCFCCCDRISNRYKKKTAEKSSLKSQNEKIELKNCSPNQNQKDVKLVFNEKDDQKVRSIIELMPSTPPTVSVTSSQISSPSKSHSSSDKLQDTKDMIIVHENSKISIDSNEDRVPVWLVIVLVISYIMGGAFMFSFWEKDWSILDGAYFCFTTLTTIGFGDLVPGSAKYSDNAEEQTKFIICCAYMIVGLSLLAMSFNLVQEEIVIKAKKFGRKIGIIAKSERDFSVSV